MVNESTVQRIELLKNAKPRNLIFSSPLAKLFNSFSIEPLPTIKNFICGAAF